MNVLDVRGIVLAALDAKKNVDEATASLLQREIENFLLVFKETMGKTIDCVKRTTEIPAELEEEVNQLRSTYGL